jgi:uncharacterized membrane protein
VSLFFAWTATLAAGLFAGAAVYVSLVEHPARLSLGARPAVHEFRPSYRRGAAMQAPLSLVGAAAGIARWASGASVEWLVGALVLGALVPFTLVVIKPINTRLLDAQLDPDSDEAAALLRGWARLHAVRTAVSVAVFAGFVALATRG